jgi:hypothetical protein
LFFKASSEAKVRVMLPKYELMKTERCKKCGKTLAEPKELIRIVKTKKHRTTITI